MLDIKVEFGEIKNEKIKEEFIKKLKMFSK